MSSAPTAGQAALVRAAFAAFDALDAAALAALTDPEVEFHPVTADVAGRPAPYRGHAGIAEYITDVRGTWASVAIELETIHASGDQVIAAGRTRARAHSGGEVDHPTCWVFSLRGERILRGQVFANRAEALAAVRGAED